MQKKKPKAREALRRLTKKHIQSAAVRTIMRVGVHGLTMDRVAEEAEVAKGTLYGYFRTKKDLVRETIEASLAPLVEELVDILDSDLPPEGRILHMTQRHLAFFEENRGFFRILLHERSRTVASNERDQSSLYQKLLRKLSEVIKQGIEGGDFRPADPDKLAAMIIDANICVIGHRLMVDKPDPVESDVELLDSVFRDGIRCRSGVRTGGRK